MLEYLRNAADKPVAKVLITILAFSFVGWGVAEWIFGGGYGDSTLVRVGRASITAQQFSNEKSHELSMMSREQMRAIYADADAANAFNTSIMTKLTTQQMAENRAHDLGFVVSDSRIAREIRAFPEFQNNGQFSAAQFDRVLAASGYSEVDFANLLRAQVARSMTLGASSVPMPMPRFAAVAAYNARYATRDIEYTTIAFSDFAATKPSDDELRQYYAAHPHVIPESRAVSYVLVPAAMDKPDSYSAAYDIAVKVEDDIIAGEPMQTAAERHGAKYVTYKAFDAEHRPVDELLNDKMITKIFAMEEGNESEMIEAKQGFVIFRVDHVTPAHNAEFESVRDGLIADWARDNVRTQSYTRANQVLVDLNHDDKMKLKNVATVSRANGAPTDVLVASFKNPVGTKTIVEGPNAFYVLHVTGASIPNADDAKISAIRPEVQKMSSRNIMDDYNAFLMRKYPVRVNERVYKKFFAQ